MLLLFSLLKRFLCQEIVEAGQTITTKTCAAHEESQSMPRKWWGTPREWERQLLTMVMWYRILQSSIATARIRGKFFLRGLVKLEIYFLFSSDYRCSNIRLGHKSICRQNFMTVKLITFDSTLGYDTFSVPSCCSCVLVEP